MRFARDWLAGYGLLIVVGFAFLLGQGDFFVVDSSFFLVLEVVFLDDLLRSKASFPFLRASLHQDFCSRSEIVCSL